MLKYNNIKVQNPLNLIENLNQQNNRNIFEVQQQSVNQQNCGKESDQQRPAAQASCANNSQSEAICVILTKLIIYFI